MRVRPLQPGDEGAVVEMALGQRLDRVHPREQDLADAAFVRRRLRRRFAPDAIGNVQSLGCFSGGRLAAFVVEADGIHPLTRERERHLVDAGCGPGDADALGELVGRVVSAARTDGVDVVRADVGVGGKHAHDMLRTFTNKGFVEELMVVRRAVGTAGSTGGEVMLTPPEHRRYALDCLHLAIANALKAAGRQVDDRLIRRYVGRRFGKLTTATQWSFLALESGHPRAHALVQSMRADLRRAHEAFVVDIFVPRVWSGRGWSARLLGHIDHFLQQRGIDRMQGTVLQINDAHSADLLRTLSGSGWWAEMQSLVLTLSGPGRDGQGRHR